jgi:vancomycin resistance protein YoaR
MRTAYKALIVVSAVSLVAAAGVAGQLVRSRLAPAHGAVPGLRIDGTSLAPGADIRAHVAARAREIEQRSVRLRIPGTDGTLERTLGELGVRLEVAEVARRASAVGRHGSLPIRLDQLRGARRGEIDVPLAVRVDPERLARVLVPLKEDTDQAPVPARLKLATRTIVPHVPGQYLDFDGTLRALELAALSPDSELEAARVALAPDVDTELLRSTNVDVVLARFETHFAPDPNRGTNIAVAAERLDGIVLAPGALVSFNEVVGARTEDNGFRPAPEIYKGEMVTGIGGGTCQVSSTLHAAAFNAGLDVVERTPHSRPSAYIALGLDSTVSWPTLDLKLRNPWPFPVVVHSQVRHGKLGIELLGREKPATVSLQRDTLAVIGFKRKVTESGFLQPGKVVQKQKGIRGFRIRTTRTIALADGTRRVETSIDHYPPTPEHLVVPPGTDESLLPPLPEGAVVDELAAAGPAPELLPSSSPSG